jgi:hypothetical protein
MHDQFVQQHDALPVVPQQDAAQPQKQALNLKDLVEVVWKLAGGLTLCCYILGFIVVTIYLSQFGFYAISLIHLQYLIVGIWAIVPLLLGWISLFYSIADDGLPFDLNKPGSLMAFGYLSGVVSFALLYFFSKWFSGRGFVERLIVLSIAGLLAGIYSLVVAWLATQVKPWRYSSKLVGGVVMLACFAGVLLFLYATNFSRHLYGDIPSPWGGGKPRVVRVIPTSKEKDEVRATGIQFSQGALVSDRVNLMLVTEKECVFLTGTSSISIRSEAIEAILYEGQ